MATVNERDLKNYREEISEALARLPAKLEAACRSFNLNKFEPMREEQPGEDVEDAQNELRIYKRISQGMQEGIDEKAMAELLRLRSVLAFIKGVAQPIERLAAHVNEKISKRVIFCDVCVRHVNDLFRKTQFLTEACADAVLTGSPILKSHVLCGVNNLARTLNEYVQDVEEKTRNNICLPPAHALLKRMFEDFRSTLGFIKEIANHIPGTMLMETWACPSPTAPENLADDATWLNRRGE